MDNGKMIGHGVRTIQKGAGFPSVAKGNFTPAFRASTIAFLSGSRGFGGWQKVLGTSPEIITFGLPRAMLAEKSGAVSGIFIPASCAAWSAALRNRSDRSLS